MTFRILSASALALALVAAAPATARQHDGEASHADHEQAGHEQAEHEHAGHEQAAHDHDHGDAEAGPAAVLPADVSGERVVARVNGLVCDFCARAVEKVFLRRDEVSGVEVDLGAGEIRVAMAPGRTLDDATLKTLIADAGYALVGIDRTGAPS